MFLTPPDPKYAESFRRYVADYRRAGEASRVSKYAAGEGDFAAYVESLASRPGASICPRIASRTTPTG